MNLKFVYLFVFLLSTLSPSFSQSKENDSLKVESLLKSIKNFGNENNFSEYSNKADSAIYLSGSNNKLLVKSLLIKSKLHWSLSKFDSAIRISNKALRVAKDNKLEKEKAAVYQDLAYIYQRKGENKNAIDYSLKALIIFEKNKEYNHTANTYSLLGVLKASLGETNEGIAYFKKALKIHQNSNNQDKIASDLLNIGTAYFYSDQYGKAKTNFLKALEITDKREFNNRNVLLMNLSVIYQHQKQLDSAYYYQLRAIKGVEKSNNSYLLARLYYNASTVKFQQKDIDSTKYYANKGLELSIEMQRYDQQINNLLMISQVDSVRGDMNAENLILKRIISLKDSILMQERKSIANEMETKYNNLKKDEIISMQQENSKLDKKNLTIAKERNGLLTWIVVSSVLLFAILLLFFITYRKLHLKGKKLHLIEHNQILLRLKEKEKELTAIALQVEQKNNLIDDFYKKIKKMTQNSTETEVEVEVEFRSVLAEIKLSLNIQKDIDLFSEKFSELHHDFIGDLKRRFPELTVKEIKLLSFLKIGLSTKQIASMQNITPAAIHKMKYRIKKKVGLSKDKSLDDFVVQL